MKLGRLGRALGVTTTVALFGAALFGCNDVDSTEEDFTSNEATLLELEFDGELTTTSTFDLEQTIQDQLLYTIGHLNEDNSVGRLDTVKVTDIAAERQEDGTTRVTYRAVLPVAWGSKTDLPKSYEFKLPKRIDYQGLEAFTAAYKDSCVDGGAHDVSSGDLWYYYRPGRSSCKLAEADIVTLAASVTKSLENTEGKYPEYHKIWEDEELRIVAIFGKYEDGATTASDAGVSAYDRFVSSAQSKFEGAAVTPSFTGSAGVKNPDVTIEATLPNGRKVVINALLVDNVSSAPPSFYTRYEGLSTEADVLFYNGHAGLGQNVRALANRGEFRAGKYQVFFMNGCDTFAYVDGALAKTRSTLNPDDPTGTKYLDMVTNAMPAFFHSMPNASLALITGLADDANPKTYQEIFKSIDSSQIVVVTGEEDNVFTPEGVETKWTVSQQDTVARGEQVEYTLGTLKPGSYIIALHEDQAALGGDADIYVGLGDKPTLSTWDFRPWLDGSNEEVRFTLEEATEVHVMVHGYEEMSEDTAAFKLSGRTAEE